MSLLPESLPSSIGAQSLPYASQILPRHLCAALRESPSIRPRRPTFFSGAHFTPTPATSNRARCGRLTTRASQNQEGPKRAHQPSSTHAASLPRPPRPARRSQYTTLGLAQRGLQIFSQGGWRTGKGENFRVRAGRRLIEVDLRSSASAARLRVAASASKTSPAKDALLTGPRTTEGRRS